MANGSVTIDEIRLGEGSDMEAPNIEMEFTITGGEVQSKEVTFDIEGRGTYTHDMSEGSTYYMPGGSQGNNITFIFEVVFADGSRDTVEVSDTLTYGRTLTPSGGNGGGQFNAAAIAAIGAVGAGAFIISRRM